MRYLLNGSAFFMALINAFEWVITEYILLEVSLYKNRTPTVLFC